MTGTAPHHEGDGCAGEMRPLSPQDRADLTNLALRLLREAAHGNHDEAVAYGDTVARHYGPHGEQQVALTLAYTIGEGDWPLHDVIDPAALDLLDRFADRRNAPRSLESRILAARVARPYLLRFLAAYRKHPTQGATYWENFYGSERTPLLISLAFSANLIIWAARAAHPSPRYTAPLN